MSIQDLFCDTIALKRCNPTFSGTNTQRVGPYAAVATGLACRIQPLSGRSGQTVIGMYPEATHMLYLGTDTEPKAQDMIVDGDSREYVVISASRYKDQTAVHHYECVLAELAVIS